MINNKTKNRQPLTVPQAASGLKVKQLYVLNWVKAGVLRNISNKPSEILIDPESYRSFGQGMSSELREAMGKTLMEGIEIVREDAQKEVNEGFRRGINHHIKVIKEVVKFLQELHTKYEKQYDLFTEVSGKVAALICYARAIQLLNSTIIDIENEDLNGAKNTFRAINDAVILTEYFSLADNDPKELPRIKSWFKKEAVLMNKDIRGYIAIKTAIPGLIDAETFGQEMRQLHDFSSKFVHHVYKDIMDTYQGYSIGGFLGDHSKRLGFDYSTVSNLRKLVPVVRWLESITSSAVLGFIISFGFLPLLKEEVKKLYAYKEYFRMQEEAFNSHKPG